jgi:hypothetical protein
MWLLRPLIFATLFGVVLAGFGYAQPTQPSDVQQRMTNALNSAKNSADQLQQHHKALVEGFIRAASPQEAQRVLDEVIANSNGALTLFGENSEVMNGITSLLGYIDDRRKNAESQVGADPRWLARAENWRSQADLVRKLRQQMLGETDRAKGVLEQLRRDRKFIEDIIASEGVERARKEMENALNNLRDLGNNLADAVKAAEEQQKRIQAPAS